MRGQTITATYRVVTPMFLSGADQKKAELRALSFKGALRFWWRALAYARHQGDLEKIALEESAWWGSTTNQSSIHLRISEETLKYAKFQKRNPNKPLAYLGYGIVETTNTNEREYIAEDSVFTIECRLKPLFPNQAETKEDLEKRSTRRFEQIRKALVAMGFFGALGARSHKGWGSIQIESLTFPKDGKNQSMDCVYNRKDLKGTIDSLFVKPLKDSPEMPKYSAFGRKSRIVLDTQEYESGRAALEALEIEYKIAIKETRPKAKLEQWGLPRNWTGAGANKSERRASPMFCHVQRLESSQPKFTIILAFLPAEFLAHQAQPIGKFEDVSAFLDLISSEEQV